MERTLILEPQRAEKDLSTNLHELTRIFMGELLETAKYGKYTKLPDLDRMDRRDGILNPKREFLTTDRATTDEH
jgi:hypothetical protein